MNKTEAMQAFCIVADNQSFTAAAKAMNISSTMVSKHIKALESSLGCLLLKRNTRKVYLTEAGEQYRQHVKPILKKLALIEHQMSEFGSKPFGKLTISASLEFGSQYLTPLISQYRQSFPQVELDFSLSNTPVDLFDSEVDLVFRVAPTLPNASHIAQEVCSSRLSLWASQAYLEQNGAPEKPEDLHQHKLLFFKHSIRKNQWIFNHNGSQQSIKLPWDWRSDNGRLLNEAAAAGQGIIQAPSYSVAPYLKNGQLVEVMPAFSFNKLTISAIYPHRYELSTRIKTFVEMAKHYFKQHPIP